MSTPVSGSPSPVALPGGPAHAPPQVQAVVLDNRRCKRRCMERKANHRTIVSSQKTQVYVSEEALSSALEEVDEDQPTAK